MQERALESLYHKDRFTYDEAYCCRRHDALPASTMGRTSDAPPAFGICTRTSVMVEMRASPPQASRIPISGVARDAAEWTTALACALWRVRGHGGKDERAGYFHEALPTGMGRRYEFKPVGNCRRRSDRVSIPPLADNPPR